MPTADQKTTRTAVIVGIIIAVIIGVIATFVPWQCSQAQTAGSFNMTFDYSAAVDEQMREEYGPEWIKIEKDRIREGWQNRKSQAREAFAQRRARVYNFDDVGGLSAADKKTLRNLYEKQRAFEAEQKRLADSAAAAQTQGALIESEELSPLYAANIGKSLSQVYEEVWSETKADNAVVIAPDWPTWVPYAILGLAAVGLIALVVKILT